LIVSVTTSGADGMPPFSRPVAVLKAGMVDGVSWMIHGTLVFTYGELQYGQGIGHTPYD
jgi:hypothetical protein